MRVTNPKPCGRSEDILPARYLEGQPSSRSNVRFMLEASIGSISGLYQKWVYYRTYELKALERAILRLRSRLPEYII
jgi:hypothetical protein